MKLDGVDPVIEEGIDEIEESGAIVWEGQLTDYGESVYESSKSLVYDEIDGKWIYV